MTLSHDARARYCIQVGVPREHLRDDIRCPACDEMHRLMHLDPDVAEVLTREPWCESCAAGDKRYTREQRQLGVSMTREVVVDRETGRWAAFITARSADGAASDLNSGVDTWPERYTWRDPESHVSGDAS